MTVISIKQLPNIQQYVQYIYPVQPNAEVTAICIFKQLFRSDDVMVDVYLDEISENTKIISGRKVTPDAPISPPRYDMGFEYSIDCVDIDGVGLPIRNDNLNKFYLQFTKEDGNDWN